MTIHQNAHRRKNRRFLIYDLHQTPQKTVLDFCKADSKINEQKNANETKSLISRICVIIKEWKSPLQILFTTYSKFRQLFCCASNANICVWIRSAPHYTSPLLNNYWVWLCYSRSVPWVPPRVYFNTIGKTPLSASSRVRTRLKSTRAFSYTRREIETLYNNSASGRSVVWHPPWDTPDTHWWFKSPKTVRRQASRPLWEIFASIRLFRKYIQQRLHTLQDCYTEYIVKKFSRLYIVLLRDILHGFFLYQSDNHTDTSRDSASMWDWWYRLESTPWASTFAVQLPRLCAKRSASGREKLTRDPSMKTRGGSPMSPTHRLSARSLSAAFGEGVSRAEIV